VVILEAGEEMHRVHQLLELKHSDAFLKPNIRRLPKRFLCNSNVDMKTGEVRNFDSNGVGKWRKELSEDDLDKIIAALIVQEYAAKFGYSLQKQNESGETRWEVGGQG